MKGMGDLPEPHVEALLQRSAWARALARSLVGDAHADDLLQDAWVVALERRPASDAAAKRWFARILENFARQRWRGDGRRAARERATARTEVQEPEDELLERFERQQMLAE